MVTRKPDPSAPPSVALVGCGYWGRNIARNLYQLGALRMVCDTRAAALAEVRAAHPGVRTAVRLEDLNPAQEQREMFICGGAEIYALALPRCSDLYLTHVHRVVDGDAWFPPFEDAFEPVAEIMQRPEFKVVHYRRRASRADSDSQ